MSLHSLIRTQLWVFLLIHSIVLGATDQAYQPSDNQVPVITVIMVIDQFAYHELQKLLDHFQGGIKSLHTKGIRYVSAFQPQGSPETGPGHAALSTGSYPKDHGFAANMWPSADGTIIACDDDNRPQAIVFSPLSSPSSMGKSPHNLMVDTLSDQLIINSRPNSSFTVYSLAIKSRSAIAMAGRLGKAVWFDEQSGWFTSSKAYFSTLPAWLDLFNKQLALATKSSFTWQLCYSKDNTAYNFPFIHDYSHTKVKPMAGTTMTIDRTKAAPYDTFSKTPLAAHQLFNVARSVVDGYLQEKPTTSLVLWLGLSNLDTVGHLFGSNSLENIDTLYQLDKDIHEFMEFLENKVNSQQILWVLTADHGIMPIVEQMQQLGFDLARRLIEKNIIPAINKALAEQWHIDNIITYARFPNIYINRKALATLDKSTKEAIIAHIKQLFMSYPGVKKVWTEAELNMTPLTTGDVITTMLKNQIYQGRTGDILVLTDPYVFASEYPEGTNHSYAYAYNTQVPLLMYRSGVLGNAVITHNIQLTQLAPTLAYLLGVQRPSASTGELLTMGRKGLLHTSAKIKTSKDSWRVMAKPRPN